MSPTLELRSVSKSFGNLEALHAVSMEVAKGAAFGLLGPNGAGKTTLIRLVTGILGPDSGQILLNGQPASGQQSSGIGYMPEERGLYKKMGVQEQLLYLARLKGMQSAEARLRIKRWLQRLELSDWAGKRIEDLSKGMQQKVQFIATVLHDPGLLILDEPFSGLDPISSNLLSTEIEELRRQGTTVIFSTHRMEQVQELCSDIVLLNRGRVLLTGQVDTIREAHKKHLVEVRYRGDTGSLTHPGFEVLEQHPDMLLIRLREPFAGNDLLGLLISRPLEVLSYREILPSLNDIFIQLITENAGHA